MHKLAISEVESEKKGEKSVTLADNFYSGLEEAERQGKVNRKRVRTETAAQKGKQGSSTAVADFHFPTDRSSKMPQKQDSSDDEQVIGKYCLSKICLLSAGRYVKMQMTLWVSLNHALRCTIGTMN